MNEYQCPDCGQFSCTESCRISKACWRIHQLELKVEKAETIIAILQRALGWKLEHDPDDICDARPWVVLKKTEYRQGYEGVLHGGDVITDSEREILERKV